MKKTKKKQTRKLIYDSSLLDDYNAQIEQHASALIELVKAEERERKLWAACEKLAEENRKLREEEENG